MNLAYISKNINLCFFVTLLLLHVFHKVHVQVYIDLFGLLLRVQCLQAISQVTCID